MAGWLISRQRSETVAGFFPDCGEIIDDNDENNTVNDDPDHYPELILSGEFILPLEFVLEVHVGYGKTLSLRKLQVKGVYFSGNDEVSINAEVSRQLLVVYDDPRLVI